MIPGNEASFFFVLVRKSMYTKNKTIILINVENHDTVEVLHQCCVRTSHSAQPNP